MIIDHSLLYAHIMNRGHDFDLWQRFIEALGPMHNDHAAEGMAEYEMARVLVRFSLKSILFEGFPDKPGVVPTRSCTLVPIFEWPRPKLFGPPKTQALRKTVHEVLALLVHPEQLDGFWLHGYWKIPAGSQCIEPTHLTWFVPGRGKCRNGHVIPTGTTECSKCHHFLVRRAERRKVGKQRAER